MGEGLHGVRHYRREVMGAQEREKYERILQGAQSEASDISNAAPPLGANVDQKHSDIKCRDRMMQCIQRQTLRSWQLMLAEQRWKHACRAQHRHTSNRPALAAHP